MANLVPQQFTAVYGYNLQGYPAMAKNVTQKLIETYETEHLRILVEMVLAGSLINLVRQKNHNLE